MRTSRLAALALAIAIIVAAAAAIRYWLPGPDPSAYPLESGSGSGEPAAVAVFHYWDDAFKTLKTEMDTQGERFNRASPGTLLVVNAIAHEAFKSNVYAMLEESNDPELFSYWAGARTEDLVRQNMLMPIDTIWQELELDAAFPAVRHTGCTYDGRKYLLPMVQSYIGMFYNRAVFERHELTPPTTWDELLAVCRRLREHGVNPIALGTRSHWPAQFWFDYILLRSAGPDYRQRLMRGEARYTDPEVRRTFELWRILVHRGFFNPTPEVADWNDAAKLLVNEGAAMTLMGTWIMDAFKQWGWKGDEYGFFCFPTIDAEVPKVTLTVLDGLVLSHSRQPAANATPVIRFFARPDVQQALSLASGNFSAHARVPRDAYSPTHRAILGQVSGALGFPYDLATLPEVERIGLKTFSAFLANPEMLEPLLEQAEAQIAPLFRGHQPSGRAEEKRP